MNGAPASTAKTRRLTLEGQRSKAVSDGVLFWICSKIDGFRLLLTAAKCHIFLSV